MSDDPDLPAEEPANLKFLRRLVTTLTAVMIVGVVVLISLVVIRLNAPPVAPGLPDTITLPDGATPIAVTYGPGWYLVVTAADEIIVFDRDSGALIQQHRIAKGN